MKARYVFNRCMVAALVALATSLGFKRAHAAELGPAEAAEGVQVLTRGPVHEAFAETVTFDPEPGIVVPKAPPATIEELPPDQRPEGANVAWIPGYWAWDDERSDFLWVSGIWRALPPGRQWVPGYWGNSAQGFQWTSGYWANAKVTEVQYLSEPPATVEAGPNIAAPSADNTWLPGCWVWYQGRYAWRPGHWAAVQPDWDWVPAHYVYAPRGYVFVDGYWDYSIGRRGVLFAPVYFDSGVYGRQGFSYSPSIAIDLGLFATHLFLRPQYQHYYFGDYYAANYQGAGFYPSYSYNSGRYGYDPIYAHQRWEHRQDRDWDRRVAADFHNRRDHENARPPRTWAAQRALGASALASRERSLAVATSLDQLARSKENRLRFQAVDKLERQNLVKHGHEVQRLRQERQKLETQAAATPLGKPSKEFVPPKVTLPRSPIAARPGDQLGKDHVPPRTYEAPKPDPKVEPKPRVKRPISPQPQPKITQPAPELQPLPKVDRPAPKPQPQPKVDRPASKPQSQPKVDRSPPAHRVDRPVVPPQPRPQPKVERPAPKPQPQPRVERPAPKPQPQPKVDWPARQPQPQPKADRPAPPPRDRPAADAPSRGPKQDKHQGKDRD